MNCPKCKRKYGRRCQKSRHHVTPRRVIREGNRETIFICTDCHAKLEEILAEKERQILQRHAPMYRVALEHFLKGVVGP